MDTPTHDFTLQVAKLELTSPPAGDSSTNPTRGDYERGLRFAHMMMSINQFEGREGAVFAHALAELLVDKGLLGKEELETMMDQVRQKYEELPTPKVMLAKSEDKYKCQHLTLIDCASRIHLCKARCCTFDFYLTEQDLNEGFVRWDYGRPYWIQHRDNGYCTHCEPGTYRCRIHPNRPYVCRAYDCRKDKRVWIDYEWMEPSIEGKVSE